MSSKPTLRDIAEATGVSTASVSMILNGKSLERFSSQRVASVLAEAERIGYRTPSARCAGKQIAILSPSVSNPYHTMMISGIDAAASAAGYQTAIYNTYWNPRTESHLLDTLDFSRVAGIIFAMTPTQPAKVRELSHRVPIVAVGDRVVDFGIDTPWTSTISARRSSWPNTSSASATSASPTCPRRSTSTTSPGCAAHRACRRPTICGVRRAA